MALSPVSADQLFVDDQPHSPLSIVKERHEVSPEDIAAQNTAMTSFKWPPLKPMIPLAIYIILSAAGPSMVFPILPRMRREYFGSDSEAVLWSSVCDSTNALIGMFTGGLIGLASDAYGRKIIILISAFEAVVVFAIQVAVGPANPWPFLVLQNFCSVLGSTKVGNAAVGFMVIADLYEKDCRMVPTIIYAVLIFVGVVTAPIPGALELSDTTTGVVAAIILLVTLIYVWLFFEETLPPSKRKRLNIKDLENPLVPLKFVFKQRYLTAFALLGICFMFPFYLSSNLNVYYLDDKLGHFSTTDNGILMASMGVTAIFALVVGLPLLTRVFSPEHIVLGGMFVLMLNSVLYCVVTEAWQAFVFLSPTESASFIALTIMSQMVSVTVAADEQGVVNGTIAALKEVATILGPIAGSLLYSLGKYHINREHPVIELPYMFSAAVCVVGVFIIVFLLFPEIRRRRALAAGQGTSSKLDDDAKAYGAVAVAVNDAQSTTSLQTIAPQQRE